METLLKNKDNIFDIKQKVRDLDPSMFFHYCINGNNIIDDKTISVVMTSSNRSKQTLFTLKTIASSNIKNVQVVIVDDSDTDPLTVDLLSTFTFYIDFIKINRENKTWHNPAVNYNIGFQYIKGGKVMIQNAEVCHIGDVLQLVNYSCVDNKYYVFDVKSSKGYEANEEIYKSDVIAVDIYNKDLYNGWYQSESRNAFFHFLSAMQRSTFDKIKEFSYDCIFGSAYDDDIFLLKIIYNNVTLVNMFHNKYLVGGLHLFHGNSANWDSMVESNKILFDNKKRIYDATGEYIEICDNIEEFDNKYNAVNTGVFEIKNRNFKKMFFN